MPILANPKEEIGAQARAKGARVKDAYVAAGYPYFPTKATQFFKRPRIVERIREIQQARIKTEFDASENAAKALGIDKRWVLEKLKFSVETALRGQPVYDRKGKPIPGRFTRPDVTGATQAAKLIGLELGMFIERHEIGGPGDFSRLTDAELAKRAMEDAAALGLSGEATEALLLTFQPATTDEAETES